MSAITPKATAIATCHKPLALWSLPFCLPGRRDVAKMLTYDEARRIAANIAKLPELLKPH